MLIDFREEKTMTSCRKTRTALFRNSSVIRRFLLMLLIVLSACSGFVHTAKAEPAAAVPAESEVPVDPAGKSGHVDEWVRKNGYMYYYGSLGKKLKGMQKIGKKKYLFDQKGRQKTGWQKVGKSYYFFQMKNGKKGYMVCSKTVNQIPLRKNGKAASTGTRMALLWKCSQIVESHTKPTWSVSKKMSTIWHWFQSNIGYAGYSFHLSGDWDVYYATLCFSKGWASCEGLGCAWAFLANACGAGNCYSVSDTGHGWAEVDGLVYDPACARYDGHRDDYYAMSMSMSGVGGRPNYGRNGAYKKRV